MNFVFSFVIMIVMVSFHDLEFNKFPSLNDMSDRCTNTS